MVLKKIVQDNSLTATKANLYSKDTNKSIGYTDGEAQELRALDILANAGDRSSASVELFSQCDDRFTTYHFSPLRGNLIKHIPISRDHTVLEIGCGFGAITRALAEKQPKELIAIEGSFNRATGASLRCEGLENIAVVHANIHDLVLPQASFDYIVLVGVCEYIKYFYPQDNDLTSEELVVDFLKKLKAYLKPQGQIVIAIENQLGLKYFLGYQEDHFEEMYVGLYDYPAPRYQKIKTFGQDKWLTLFHQAELNLCALDLPFPDYKFPHTVINAQFLDNDKYAANLLYNYQAANYDNNYVTAAHTNLLWPCLVSNKIASRFADSFLFVVSAEADFRSSWIDFVHYPNYKRKNEFWSVVVKERTDTLVQRYATEGGLKEPIESKTYYSLPLLAQILCQVTYSGSWEQLIGWLKVYLSYLHEKYDQKQLDHDATVSNLLVDQSTGKLISFDHEWLGKFSATPEFVLFRSVLYWSVDNCSLLNKLNQNVHSIQQFMQLLFDQLGITLNKEILDDFIKQEVLIAEAIFRQVNAEDFAKLLDLKILDAASNGTYETFISQKIQDLTELAEKRFAIMNEMDALVKDRDQYIKSLEAEKSVLKEDLLKSETSLTQKSKALAEVEQQKEAMKQRLAFWEKHPYLAFWRRITSGRSNDT